MSAWLLIVFANFTGGLSAPDDQCPRGYYCPESSIIGTQYGCPNGTYNDLLGLDSEYQCKNCTQGKVQMDQRMIEFDYAVLCTNEKV